MKKMYIYKVTNLVNGKVYIGKTYNFEKRKREHFYDIDNGLPLHKALKKYGADSFEWEVIDEADSEKDIRALEAMYIEMYNSWVKADNSNGYNITTGLLNGWGYSHNSKEIACYDKEGRFLRIYRTITQAEYETGADLGFSKGKKVKISKGMIWLKDIENENVPMYIEVPKKDKKEIAIYQCDLEGNILNEYPSATKASEKLEINRATISRATTQNKTAGGFRWIKVAEYDSKSQKSFNNERGYSKYGKGIAQLDGNKQILNIYTNCAEAGRAVGASSHKIIHKAIKGRHKSCGFYWEVLK